MVNLQIRVVTHKLFTFQRKRKSREKAYVDLLRWFKTLSCSDLENVNLQIRVPYVRARYMVPYIGRSDL